MKALQEVAEQQEMTWTKTKSKGVFKPEYELRAGNDVLATLRWKEAFGSLAEGETTSGRWTFKRCGFFRPRVTVRPAGQDVDAAVFILTQWDGSGLVEFPDGRKFRWFRTSFWSATYTFAELHGATLLQFDPNWLGTSAKLEIKPAAKSLPELSLLALLGWYLLILMNQDSSAAAAGAVVVVS